MVGDPAIFGILTVSDRASKGEYQDEGGPAILGFFEEAISSEWSHHYRVVPEATEMGCDRIMPGFGEQMRAISLEFVPTAILSRQLGGTRGQCVIFNLPGRPKAIRETIDEIWKAVPYCVDLLNGPYIDMNDSVCDAFRPKNARRR